VQVPDSKQGQAFMQESLQKALDFLISEARAIHVMDCGRLDFERLPILRQIGAFFVPRASRI
jgi:hypothetical protein